MTQVAGTPQAGSIPGSDSKLVCDNCQLHCGNIERIRMKKGNIKCRITPGRHTTVVPSL